MKLYTSVILSLSVAFLSTLVSAQDGPTPPRLNIPGALPLPLRPNPQFRADRPGPQVVRVRRPILRPQPINSITTSLSPRIIDEAKPVTENPDDEIPTFVPQILAQQQLQQHQQQQQSQQPPQQLGFFTEPNFLQQEDEAISIPRFQDRPLQQRQQQTLNDFANIGNQRFAIEQRPQRPAPVQRTRPSAREPRPHFEQQEQIPIARPVPVRNHHNIQPRPIDSNNLNINNHEQKPKKPISQILRKYRDEHEDGTITWGYENDDGSFKEEVIGTDCITRGTYGYIDPDGNKREYNYETGIKCDPNKRGGEDSEELEQSGFVNYDQNKAILPNGLEIDLSSMGKKKSKRPAVLYQQQPQQQQGGQQQFYRN